MSEDTAKPMPMAMTSTTMVAGAVEALANFKPSYRTAAGWVCVAAIAQVFFLSDWENFVLQFYSLQSGRSVPKIDRLNESYTLELISLLLLLSGIKSFDRTKGVATN